jgi:hypothetical protein
MAITKVISGGQTGVDRAALDVALELGIPCGGFCPKGRKAEDGRIPDRYPLTELASADYPARTRRNVQAADSLLVLVDGVVKDSRKLTGGTALTIRLAADIPTLVMGLDDALRFTVVMPWLRNQDGRAVMIAGPRESKCPGIHDRAAEFLRSVLIEDFGKVRVYSCPCGGQCVRPIYVRQPKPCEACGLPLTDAPSRVEDELLFVKDLLRRAKGGRP